MDERPRVTIYAAGAHVGTEGRAASVAVLLTPTLRRARAVGEVGTARYDQQPQADACSLALETLTQSCQVEMVVAYQVVAQMAQSADFMAVLAITPFWARLAAAAKRHAITWVYRSKTQDARLNCVCFAAYEMALAGEIVPEVLEDARRGVQNGSGLLSFSVQERSGRSYLR